MKYYALDVETANPSISSICQIGIAKFDDGKIVEKYNELLNPEDYFDPFNVEIHGITESKVLKAKKFPEVYKNILTKITGNVVIHHMPFDKTAIGQACQKYGLPKLECQWLDSAKVARRTWSDISQKGYSLSNICNMLRIEFKHHDALEDAIAAGTIIQFAIEKSGIDLESWIYRSKERINEGSPKQHLNVHFEGNSEGPLWGETIVFTGSLSITRDEAARIAANAGCNVTNNINPKCTILVLGQQDIEKLAGKSKSTKQIKAEELIREGFPIQIISEDDFVQLVEARNKL